MSSAVGTALVLPTFFLASALGIVTTDTPTENSTQVFNQAKGEYGSSGLAESYWPPVTSLIKSSWALVQGRGNKGNKGGQGMMMMMGGMMLMMGLTALAALSGKAVAASMAALMLAAMSLMKKGSGGGHSSYEVITVPHGGHHHRSLAEGEAYASAYGYDSSAESLTSSSNQIINNHHMSVR